MSRVRNGAGLVLLAFLFAGCPAARKAEPARSIPAGDAVEFRDGLGSDPSEAEQILARGGFGHVFLPAIRLERRADGWTAADVPPPARPLESLPVVLVVEVPPGTDTGSEAGTDAVLAGALEDALGKTLPRRAAYGKVEGVHLAIPFPAARAESFGALLDRLRKRVPADLFLTCELDAFPPEKEREEFRKRLASADGYVTFLFGEGVRGDPAGTDSLGKPWFAGYAPTAHSEWKDASGAIKGVLQEAHLAALTDQPLAPLSQELSLTQEGASDYFFHPTASFEIDGRRFEPGDRITFRQPAVSELLYRFGSDLTGRRFVRGRLVRLEGTSDGQRLFTLAALSDAFLGHSLLPDLRVKVTPEATGVRIEAENVSSHASVLSRTTNWIEVDVPPGHVRDVQLGGFDRYEVFDAEGRPVTPGRAAKLRFYELLVGPRERIAPATILLRSKPPSDCCRFREHLLAASGMEVNGDWIAPPPVPTPTPKPAAPARKKRG
jgi:hypothetical protein